MLREQVSAFVAGKWCGVWRGREPPKTPTGVADSNGNIAIGPASHYPMGLISWEHRGLLEDTSSRISLQEVLLHGKGTHSNMHISLARNSFHEHEIWDETQIHLVTRNRDLSRFRPSVCFQSFIVESDSPCNQYLWRIWIIAAILITLPVTESLCRVRDEAGRRNFAAKFRHSWILQWNFSEFALRQASVSDYKKTGLAWAMIRKVGDLVQNSIFEIPLFLSSAAH